MYGLSKEGFYSIEVKIEVIIKSRNHFAFGWTLKQGFPYDLLQGHYCPTFFIKHDGHLNPLSHHIFFSKSGIVTS